MTDDDPIPDRSAMQRQQDMEQMEAGLRTIAETVVTIRRTLVEGGFPDDTANLMAMRAWMGFFPGQPPPAGLGFLFGGQQ